MMMNKQLKMMVWTASVMLVLSMVFGACNNKKSKSYADDEDEDDIELADDYDDEDMYDEDEEEPRIDTIDVRTARELILAMKDNVHINVITNDVLRMTDAINDLIDDGKLKAYPQNRDNIMPGLYWGEEYDGNTLFIVGLKNVSLEALPEDGGFLMAIPRYADVLHFERCKNLVIKNFTMGHEERGDCVGDVLVVNDCENVAVNDCNLFGCGVNGFSASGTSCITVKDTHIYGCSDRGIDLYDSDNVYFETCEIFNNGCGMYVDPNCVNVAFNGCKFQDIRGQMFICYSPVHIHNSKVVHHHDDNAENVTFTNCDVVMDYAEAEVYPDIEED